MWIRKENMDKDLRGFNYCTVIMNRFCMWQCCIESEIRGTNFFFFFRSGVNLYKDFNDRGV